MRPGSARGAARSDKDMHVDAVYLSIFVFLLGLSWALIAFCDDLRQGGQS